jgi:hypothetical protein
MDGNIPAGLGPQWTMEVVLEAVELGTTDPFQNFDEMVLLLWFLFSFEAKYLPGMAIVTLYWLPLFPKQELMNIYVTAVFTKIVLSFFF